MVDKEGSREIRRHIRRVLMAESDPIGVSDIPEAADEYDSYIGGVYELLERAASEPDICTYLRNIEVDRMEMVDASRQPLLPEAKRNAVASSLKELALKSWAVISLRPEGSPLSSLATILAHGINARVDAVGIVYQPVKDTIGQRGIANKGWISHSRSDRSER
jgi:hypothetical protein